MDFELPYPSGRSPVFGREAMATSHPAATMAGMDILNAGGNAVDAALAAAMALTVVEPTGCGIGSDAFAIVWDGRQLHGLNSSGRSPASWTPASFAGLERMPQRGWNSVTVPGAVAGWIALWRRFGRLPLGTIAAPAIRSARDGYPVSPIVAKLWSRAADLLRAQPGFAACFMPLGRAPRAGETFRSPAHAKTLETIVASEGDDFYRGDLARAIAEDARRHGARLTADDLASHQVEWVSVLSQRFGDAVVHELPPNGQGIATLIALGVLDVLPRAGVTPDDPDFVHLAIEATKLGLGDLAGHVGDPAYMPTSAEAMLDRSYLAGRAGLINSGVAGDFGHGQPGPGGTVCLVAADAGGMMVSFIQSNYLGFGSGVVVPGTGISLQNRGAGFVLDAGHPNEVGPRKRPLHTIIPGFATTRDGAPLMAFGLMGGPMQAQGHVQLASRILRFGQNPQAASDAPRWRILSGRRVAVERQMAPALVSRLRALGHEVVFEAPDEAFAFGGAQVIVRRDNGYVAGSDHRKDGMAAAR